MKKIIIQTPKAPPAIGPYSQAIKIENIIYTSGIIPLHPDSGIIFGKTLQEQTHQVFKNLIAVLTEAKANLDTVIKTTCYLTNMTEFAAFNEIYEQYFSKNKPARSCIGVSALPKSVLVEIEVIALCTD